ncbi:hypothetical protein, partial [Enterococcus avium]|uniref:hypothetical protein n=1 Tax=Enterococcus avium TaxID=33945 RepID=UPI002891B30C
CLFAFIRKKKKYWQQKASPTLDIIEPNLGGESPMWGNNTSSSNYKSANARGISSLKVHTVNIN